MTGPQAAAASRPIKLLSLEQAVATIPQGATIALGGRGLMHRPMAALREVARQRLRNLRLVGWDCGLDLDFLAGAGCLASAEAPMRLDGHDTEPNRDRAAAAGTIRLVDLQSDAALAGFRAAAMGLPSLPLRPASSAGAAQSGKPFIDPVSGERLIAAPALAPDVAIIHGRLADAAGNVRLHADDEWDAAPDLTIARAARMVIVTVEQFVSDEAVRSGSGVLLRADEVAAVAEAPYGAHPCGFADRYAPDGDELESYRAAAASAEDFAAWLSSRLPNPDQRPGYLDAIGSRRLMALSRNRVCLQ